MKRLLLIIGLFWLLPAIGWAQIGSEAQSADSLSPDNADLDVVIEDAITDIESDESTDWTILTDYLDDLRRKPLNLNRAGKDELLLLPGMNEI